MLNFQYLNEKYQLQMLLCFISVSFHSIDVYIYICVFVYHLCDFNSNETRLKNSFKTFLIHI